MEHQPTALEQIKKIDEQRSKLLEQAIVEAKERAIQAISDLNSLGFAYQLSESLTTTPVKPKRRAPTHDKFCNICNLAGHDARNHRNQNPKKKFTKAELEEKGLTATTSK